MPGSGTQQEPWRIESLAAFNEFAADEDYWDDYTRLETDIDLEGIDYTTAPIAPDTDNSNSGFQGTLFSGIFDGNGHTISNLAIDTTWDENDYLGLFGQIAQTGQVKNLDLEDVDISGRNNSDRLGGLCGRNDGIIKNCHASGTVAADDDCRCLGGLCGENYGTITDCSAVGSIRAEYNPATLGGLCGSNYGTLSNCSAVSSIRTEDSPASLGGLCGFNQGTVNNCSATGYIDVWYYAHNLGCLCGKNYFATISNSSSTGYVDAGNSCLNLGGLCGENYHGQISNCYSTASVVVGSDSYCIGGLCGFNDNWSTVGNCYATGSVTGRDYCECLGGFCGENAIGTISKCYATGSVSARWVPRWLGGFCGVNAGHPITNCYFLQGCGPDNGHATALTDSQMKQQSSFHDWDFVFETANGTDDIWCMPAWCYPQLVWAHKLPGSGTEPDPYLIEDLADFYKFAADANYWHDYVRLECNIDLTGITYTTAVIAPDVNNSNSVFDGAAFSGVFDGSRHKITALTVDDSSAGNDYLGLFGYNSGQIRDLCLEGASVNGDDYVAGLVGWNEAGVSNCCSTGDVSGDDYVGGLIGQNDGALLNSYSSAYVSDGNRLGGLVGWNNGTVFNCCATGCVSSTGDYVAGLVGVNLLGTVSNCYSTSDVNGDDYVAGLVGWNEANISNCYSTGDVGGDEYVAALLGLNNYGNMSNCFWDTDMQSHGVTESIAYSNGGTVTNVQGLPTTQMQTRPTFTDAGWDFVNETVNGANDIWRMCWDGGWYPRLAWQFYEWADFVCPDRVDLKDFSYLAARFGQTECAENNNCDGADLNYSGVVDYTDVKVFTGLWLKGRAVPGELAVPPGVGFTDYAELAGRWLNQECWLKHNCHGADLDFSGTVNWTDLKIFTDHWLEQAGLPIGDSQAR